MNMKKEEIIADLDALKLKIMLSDNIESDLDKYDEWLNELIGKFKNPKPWNFVLDNRKYALFRTLEGLVITLFERKHGRTYDYQKNERELREMFTEIIAMTLFYQELNPTNKQ